MEMQNVTLRPVRRPQIVGDTDRRGVHIPVGADSKIFGGWGVRF